MPEEGFLRRWARVKATGNDVADPAPPPAQPSAPATARWARAGDATPPVPAADHDAVAAAVTGEPSAAPARTSPTLEDVARLTPDSDYSVFVGQGVDKSVQRLALKKLFADPHFNVPDRLDMYMDDYNIPSPVSEEMLASLDHARSALRRFVEEPAEPDPAAEDALQAVDPAAVDPGTMHGQALAAAMPEPAPHNDAVHAATLHQHGPFHSPNQPLPEGQA